jgi:hypothetical protein
MAAITVLAKYTDAGEKAYFAYKPMRLNAGVPAAPPGPSLGIGNYAFGEGHLPDAIVWFVRTDEVRHAVRDRTPANKLFLSALVVPAGESFALTGSSMPSQAKTHDKARLRGQERATVVLLGLEHQQVNLWIGSVI